MNKPVIKHKRKSYKVRNLLVAAAASVAVVGGAAQAAKPIKLGMPILHPHKPPFKPGLPIPSKPNKPPFIPGLVVHPHKPHKVGLFIPPKK